MSYIVLARKYRPKQFAELVGQNHVSTTLLHAFQQNKIGQAYLFTGTRGVGKTSVARIFAKALRCESADAKLSGISCDKCGSCIEINNGSSMDVLEIDGASNNGVENVREIREQVKFLPSRGRMKVYIIDEVHMLSNAAFNALLKTLEEPPSHITFLFATTEVQKIPATILSRCQRFDLKRVPQPLILEHIHKISKLEGIQAESAALGLISKKADGSIRDALSALDQCIALAGKNLSVKSVTESLGIVSGSFLLKLLDLSFKREINQAALMLQEAFLQGVEMKQIAIGLADTLRNALFVKLRADSALTEIEKEERAEYDLFVSNISSESIQAGYRLMVQAAVEILRSPLPKASLEMSLIRLSGIGHLKSLETLLQSFSSGQPATSAITNNATVLSEKKNPEPNVKMDFAEKARRETISLNGFVQIAMQQKPSLGALLEHAVCITPEETWNTADSIHIGFRKNHGFYQLQAQHKTNHEHLEKMLQTYVQKKVSLRIESIEKNAEGTAVSVVEKEQKISAEAADVKKKRFLEHEIVRNTKEIFGAELASFDIDKSKL